MSKGERMTRRCWVTGGGAAASVLALAACGRSGAGGVSGERADVPPTLRGRGEPVTVTVWHAANAITESGRELLRAFEEAHPLIKVDWQAVEWAGSGQMLQRLPIAAASGDLPDTFRGHWSNFGNIIHQKWVRPLNDYMRQAGLSARDFTPSTWQISSYQGQIYAMPSYAYTLAPMWNKDLLRRHGLDPEKLPATLDQVLEASVRVLRTEVAAADQGGAVAPGPRIMSLGWTHRTATPGHFVFLFGAQVYDAARERVTPDHQGVVDALSWLLLVNRRQGGYQWIEQFFTTAGANPFFGGHLAVTNMQPRSFSDVTRLAAQLDLGVTYYPTRTGSLQEVARTSVQAEVLPITRTSAHPDETWTFLKWLHVDKAVEWGVRTLNTPCLLKAVEPFFEQIAIQRFTEDRRLVPYLGIYKEMSRRGTSYWPTMPTTLEYLNAFTAAWHDVLQEKTAPQAAMKELARTQQVELEKALAAK